MPSERDLPRSRRRDFVEEMFDHYRAAGRPALRQICEAMENVPEPRGTASRETIRRTLKGETVPLQWANVYVVVAALASFAGRDLSAQRWDDDYGNDSRSFVEVLKQLWNEALDEEPGTLRPPAPATDPWSMPAGVYSDEPPF
ncbi:hypothetical protein [Frankia tisae]|uniref:hypothetical protein n=1 Tax=Frankia tisae TaxID=2950104 RepID=UPI0021C0A545|nr:hypothetical protein [Frankia tisae]